MNSGMEAKSESRKRKDISGVATPTSRLRLNEKSGNEDSFVVPVKDLRVHRIFSPVSIRSVEEDEDCGDMENSFESERVESVEESVRTTPPDEVLVEAKEMDASEKACVNTPLKRYDQRIAGRRSPGFKSLNPCSRTKLFGSFSYRRLFPYLMDITKGALKRFDMKPQLLKNDGGSVVESSPSILEHKSSCETEGINPCKIFKPNICTECSAEEVPLNFHSWDQEVLDPSRICNLSQNGVSTNENDSLFHSKAENVTKVLAGMVACSDGNDSQNTVTCDVIHASNCVDSAAQHSQEENRNDLMGVLEDALSCKIQGFGDVHLAKENDMKHDKPLTSICCTKSTRVVQETPLDDKVCSSEDIPGIAECVLKPNAVIFSKKNSDSEELVVSEAKSTFPREAIIGSSYVHSFTQQSTGESRCEKTHLLGDSLLCLGASDAYEVKENVVDYEKPQSTLYSQNNAELIQKNPISNDDISKKDVIEKVKSFSKPENQLEGYVTSNTGNSVCEQVNDSADSRQTPSSEGKLYLKPRRLRRFKNYNSVSYKKLLPYLTEIYEDCAGQVKKDGAPALLGDSVKKTHCTYVSGTTLSGDSSPASAASCVVEPKMTNFECFSELDAGTKSPTESHLENGLKSTTELQFFSHVQGQHIQCLPSSCAPNGMPMGKFVIKPQCAASNFKEEDMTRSKLHYDDLHLSDFVSLDPEPILFPGRPCASPIRGILKKSPRGCRGLCTCLKCASFHLRAEKTFELSRNQLLDSEEITLELINELSLLHNLLKTSTDADVGKTSQVQEACKRADAVGQNAKARLEQMNHVLSHCQIPLRRPF